MDGRTFSGGDFSDDKVEYERSPLPLANRLGLLMIEWHQFGKEHCVTFNLYLRHAVLYYLWYMTLSCPLIEVSLTVRTLDKRQIHGTIDLFSGRSMCKGTPVAFHCFSAKETAFAIRIACWKEDRLSALHLGNEIN